MSAPLLTEVLEAIDSISTTIIMNFANPDMVGHTGIFDGAAVSAIETLDGATDLVVQSSKDGQIPQPITAMPTTCR